MQMKVLIKKFLKSNRLIYQLATFCYLLISNYDGREHVVRTKSKKNSNITFYVIRPRTNCVEGLMSLTANVLNKIYYAEKKGYIPVVDMQNYKTQYELKGRNVWTEYFKQVSDFSLEEVYESKNVILSGYTYKNCLEKGFFFESILFDEKKYNECQRVFKKYIKLSTKVIDEFEKEVKKQKFDDNVLGVYLRGTDYIKLKPLGHFIQPSVEQMQSRIDLYIKKYNIKQIFLVTEDKTIYDLFLSIYTDKLKIVTFDSFISNYEGKEVLSKSGVFTENNYDRGLHYLIKLLILSSCQYQVSSITSASAIVKLFNNNQFKNCYYFNLGLYE